MDELHEKASVQTVFRNINTGVQSRGVFVYIGSSQHSLVNGDGRVDESGFVSNSSTPHLPAAAAGRKPTAPSASRVRCGSLSSNSSTASSSYM